MKFRFLSIFPELIDAGVNQGVVGQALKKNIISFESIDLRQFAKDKHKSVDDKPFGGIDGMLMKPEVLDEAIISLKSKNGHILYPSPQGKVFNQQKAQELATKSELIFLCGRYAGIDNRIIVKHAVEEISIGDYVVSGGEWPSLIIMDAVARCIPGVLGNQISFVSDSFQEGLLEAPMFTRPSHFYGLEVPKILTNGDHQKIQYFNSQLALLVTLKKREDLFRSVPRDIEELLRFYNELSESDRKVCGIDDLGEKIKKQLSEN